MAAATPTAKGHDSGEGGGADGARDAGTLAEEESLLSLRSNSLLFGPFLRCKVAEADGELTRSPIVLATQARLPEVWLAKSPFLLYTYLSYYTPDTFRWIFSRIATGMLPRRSKL